MAHVVGVPKRDPCRKCQLPVFLAERLMVGKKVYHRTCLKCARCGYQLTPGSFYETEVDEQYCCETCPDEEVAPISIEQLPIESKVTTASDCSNVELRNKVGCETNALTSSTRSMRSSIRDRLAFFENRREENEADTKLVQKSLSDEEKSKSLQRMESSAVTATVATYKTNVALSTFLNNAVGDAEDLSDSSSVQISKMETSESEDDTVDLTNVSLPPKLPKSLPPLEKFNVEKTPEEKKRFSVSAQLILGSSPNTVKSATENADEEQNIVREPAKENLASELQIDIPSNIKIDKTNNNNLNNEAHISAPSFDIEEFTEHQTVEETVQSHPNKLENNLEYSETNDNNCITKDKSAGESTIMNKTANNVVMNDTSGSENKPVELKTIDDNESIKKDVVELRTKSDEKNSDIPLQSEDNETTERLSVVRARLQQFEVITNNEIEGERPSKPQEDVVDDKTNKLTTTYEDFTSKPIDNEPLTTELCENMITTTQVNNIEFETETESLNTTLIDDKVPLTTETKDNEILESNLVDKEEHLQGNNSKDNNVNEFKTPQKNTSKTTTIEEYPEDLNPFKSDEEDEEAVLDNNKENVELRTYFAVSTKKDILNPFDSSDDEVELEKAQNLRTSTNSTSKVPPPRPPPPRISRNPFGSDDEDDTKTQSFNRRSSLTGSQSRKTPVPTPRTNISQSQNPTPELTPRLNTKINTPISSSASTTPNNSSLPILQNSSDFYGSVNSLHSSNTTPYNLLRNSDVRSSNNSLNLSAGGTIRSRKSRRAPLPPAPVKELFPSNETINSSSKTSTPSSSTVGTPKSARKKRPAPAPPKPARLEPPQVPQIHVDTISTQPKNLNSYPLQSELDSKLSDEEKALLEGKTLQSLHSNKSALTQSPSSRRSSKRLIPLDKELLEEHGSLQYVEHGSISQCDDLKQQNQKKSSVAQEEEASVVYRRLLIPQNLETPTHEQNPLIENLSKSPSLGERQLEKLKDNKEANNRNRQSQISVASSGGDDNDPLFNKSSHGKWKRRKGPAPALPIPPRKVLQMLPLQEIKHELEIIEVQQQGLEKQGVILEKMIRDRCEGENGEPLNANALPGESGDSASGSSSTADNSKEVENLILQLFELVNEKNELFRRQAELMYLRRQHRLEQEQADLEYEIRILMAQPERNKTDSDKAREEALIERLVEVVKLRNEVVDCLEMDRLREAEEDQSIKQRLESHIAKRDADSNRKTLTKLSKKEKKKQKEAKKLSKSKKLDADKDADESELCVDKQKSKKKKKLLIF